MWLNYGSGDGEIILVYLGWVNIVISILIMGVKKIKIRNRDVTRAEVGVMCQQAKEWWQPPEAVRSKDRILP